MILTTESVTTDQQIIGPWIDAGMVLAVTAHGTMDDVVPVALEYNASGILTLTCHAWNDEQGLPDLDVVRRYPWDAIEAIHVY